MRISVQTSLKYAAELTEISKTCTCPPSKAHPASGEFGVRFFHQPPIVDDDLPNALRRPERVDLDASRRCNSFGLSFFESAEKARQKWQILKLQIPNIEKIMGTHIYGGTIDRDHGLVTKPSQSSGHFTLFEFRCYSAISTLAMIGPICEAD